MADRLMRPLTAIEVSANAATRWREQYKNWYDEDKFADGTTKASINNALNSCQHTPENVAKVINPGWAYPSCDCCGEYREVVVSIVRPYHEDSPIMVCEPCVKVAASILSQFPNAGQEVPKK